MSKLNKRKIIIDAGAHIGQSIDRLREKFVGEEVEIFSFEPHPRCFLVAKTRENETTRVEHKAVWIEDGEIELYCDSLDLNTGRDNPGEGSTIFEVKTKENTLPGQFDSKSKVIVPAFDFSKWLSDNFSREDFIHLKMDIEGAEYEVLKKMIENDTISYIDELDVEFHWNFIQYPKEEHDKILEKLKEYNLSLTIHE
jgi:FkbM family methyltransferase